MTQAEYIAILFVDYGFDTAKRRKDFLQTRFGVSFPDELTKEQASSVIEQLICRRAACHAQFPTDSSSVFGVPRSS